ncbi:hypothetical protein JQC67_16575 [Aurantibacter crassamenti]|uniref:hypothetical protein n=1 Tax=Aurantibacter crassamenti TaxID=1837375 RepID=UPI001939C6A8|nr:hypothetical protein [Aurantibacter crassamenti]MBM1107773.1 hypothetical protein [Aurantibacter crassamenti]
MNNGLFYATHTELPAEKIADFQLPEDIKAKVQYVLTEWHVSDKNALVFVGSSREIMRIDFVTEGHGVQEIAFNPRVEMGDIDFGKLYMCIGDGAAVQLGYPQVVDQPGIFLEYYNTRRSIG